MEASGPSGNTSVHPQQTMTKILGTAIAVITLILPIATIAYFSTNNNIDPIQKTTSTTNLKNNF
jgi:hypothetical protein